MDRCHVTAQFSPDGKRIATAAHDGTARLWDAQTGEPLTGVLKHDSQVDSVRFSADGKKIATASKDGAARVWDAQTGQLLKQFTSKFGGLGSATSPLLPLKRMLWIASAQL